MQVRYECEIMSIMVPINVEADGTAEYEHSYLAVNATLTNTGMRTTRISWFAFGLIVPYSKEAALLQPVTDYRAQAPLPLEPGQCRNFQLRPPEQLREEILNLGVGWFPRLRIRRLRLTFAAESGDVFRAKLGKRLRAYIRETASETSWIYQRAKTGVKAENSNSGVP